MTALVQQLLFGEELSRVQRAVSTLSWVSGDITAGRNVIDVKQNRQADPNSGATGRLGKLIAGKIFSDPVVKKWTQARRSTAVTISRFGVGDHYGPHLDNLYHGRRRDIRADVSCSLFLNSPEEYEGGELCVWNGASDRSRYKLPAGVAVFYRSNLIHEVLPITRGERHAAVLWLESSVRDHEKREILYELGQILDALDREKHGETMRATRCYNAIMRRWVT